MERIGEAVRPFPKAALFELADEGFGSVFELLVACIISIRTRDETTLICARRLFELARGPEAMSRLAPERIDRAIALSTFHHAKARQIRALARRLVADRGGGLHCDQEMLAP